MARRTLNQFLRNLRRGVGNTYQKKQMQKLGKLAITLIVARTKLGDGVKRTGAKPKKLKPLSPAYKEYRRNNRSLLDKSTTPNKSNLTFTGIMLRSMRVIEASNRRVKWGPNNVRRKGGGTNAQIAVYQEQKGRPFNYLSEEDIFTIEEIIETILQNELDKL